MQDDAGVRTAPAPARAGQLGADPHDFAGLYIRHRSSFTAHARRYLRDPRDADEVVQEAFLRVFLAMPELESELQALAYCRRTITNLCIDRYRADARKPRLVTLDGAPVEELAEDDSGDPVVRAEDAALVREALSQLPQLHRAALVKREIEEKPLPVIAHELDLAEDSVKHLLFRARRGLRKLLAGTSVAPGVDAELTRGLRPLRRGASGGAAGLLLLALLGLGSGPDLRAVPVVGVDLPDVLGVTAVADALSGAVRDAVDAIVPRDDAHAGGTAPDRPSRPVSRSGERPADAPALPAAGERIAPPPPAAITVPDGTSRRNSGAEPGPAGTGRTAPVATVVDGRPSGNVVPAPLLPPEHAPGTDARGPRPGVSSGRGLEPPLPAPAAARPPTTGREVRTARPISPLAPVAPDAAPPALPRGADAPGRSARAGDIGQRKAADKAADRAAHTAEKVEQSAEKAAEKTAAVAGKSQDKAAEKTAAVAEKSQDKADRAAQKALDKAAQQGVDKAEPAVTKGAGKAAEAAADRAAAKAAAQQAAAAERSAGRAADPAAVRAAERAAAAAAAAQPAAAVPATAVAPVTAP